MGNFINWCISKIEKSDALNENDKYKIIGDHYHSFSELEVGLRKAGLETSQLIVGIDFTKSNTWQGGLPYFQYENLHTICEIQNPYQQVLSIMCQALAPFDEDNMIDAYGFGDAISKNVAVFPLNINGYEQPCYRLDGVLEAYNNIAPHVQFSGPTSFAPIINKAIDLVKQRKQYHILLIIADGVVDDFESTKNAIIEASKYPLSIVCVGVGKGPWDQMEEMDDKIFNRKFDNFQFVDFHKIMQKCENETLEFAKHALMEVPYQYEYIKKNILSKRN